MSQNCFYETNVGYRSSHAEYGGRPHYSSNIQNYNQNLTVYSVAHVPSFHQILWKSTK